LNDVEDCNDREDACYVCKKAVLSHGEPRDAAVNFDTYRILQWHGAVSLPQHGFLVYISDRSNAEITHSRPTLIFTAVTQNHRSTAKLRDTLHQWRSQARCQENTKFFLAYFFNNL